MNPVLVIMQLVSEVRAKRVKVIIIGTTVSGKSHLSLQLGHHFKWNIINTDTAAFYSGADILSGKPTVEEMDRVRHHCVDFLSLDDCCYNMKDFISKVDGIVESRGESGVLIVGGSNFYNEKVIFQRRSKLISEAQQDHHSRLKHNIGLFSNEFLLDSKLKCVVEMVELKACFEKLLQKEKEIPHEFLRSRANRLKYVLLHAPIRFLEILMTRAEPKAILRFLKRLFPFCGGALCADDTRQMRALLYDFVCGKPQQRAFVEEALKKDEKEEMLVVILCNTDETLVVKLIRRRLQSRLLTRPGIAEVFKVFERLLIRPSNAYNILDKYIRRVVTHKCSGPELVLLAYQDLMDLLKINKANRYGILNTRGYREFVPFYEKFWLAVVQRLFRLVKGRISYTRFLEFYENYRDSLAKELRRKLSGYFKESKVNCPAKTPESDIQPVSDKLNVTNDSILSETPSTHLHTKTEKNTRSKLPNLSVPVVNYPDPKRLEVNVVSPRVPRPKDLLSVFIDCVKSLEKEMLMLYKKQRSWLSSRVMNNNLLKNRIMVKNIDKSHLTDIAFREKVVNPVIRKIESIMEEIGNLGSLKPEIAEESNLESRGFKVENPFLKFKNKTSVDKYSSKKEGIANLDSLKEDNCVGNFENLESQKLEMKSPKFLKKTSCLMSKTVPRDGFEKVKSKQELETETAKEDNEEEAFLQLAKRGRLRSCSISITEIQDLETLPKMNNFRKRSSGFKRVQYGYPTPTSMDLNQDDIEQSKTAVSKVACKIVNPPRLKISRFSQYRHNLPVMERLKSEADAKTLIENRRISANVKYRSINTGCPEPDSKSVNYTKERGIGSESVIDLPGAQIKLSPKSNSPTKTRTKSVMARKYECRRVVKIGMEDLRKVKVKGKRRRGSAGKVRRSRIESKRYSTILPRDRASVQSKLAPEIVSELKEYAVMLSKITEERGTSSQSRSEKSHSDSELMGLSVRETEARRESEAKFGSFLSSRFRKKGDPDSRIPE